MNHIGSEDSSNNPMQVSRRSFIQLAVGSISMVPATIAAMPTSAALAESEEEDEGLVAQAEGADDTVALTVAKPSQVNVVILDVTSGGKARVPNANVTIRSSNSKSPIVTNTGSSGVATIDIAELSDPEGLKKEPKEYQFFGTISVTADGYRSFRSGLMCFNGATVVQGATRRLEPGVFYPALCTFNGFDILYATSTFIRSTSNKSNHVLAIELENAGNDKIAFRLTASDGTMLVEQDATPSNGVAKFTFSRKFLQYGHASVLPEAKSFVAKYEQKGKHYEHPLRLAVETAPAEAQAPIDLSNVALAPLLFNALDMNMGFKFPNSLPLIGGSTLKPPWPDLPVHIGIDPFGYVRISARTPEFGWSKSASMGSARKENDEKAQQQALRDEAYQPLREQSDDDPLDQSLIAQDDDNKVLFDAMPAGTVATGVKEEIGWISREHWKKQFTNMPKKWTDGVDAWKNTRLGKGGENRDSSRTINWSQKISFTVMGQATGWGEWRTGSEAYQKGLADENYWRLGVAFQGILQFKFDYMWNIMVWVIPVVIGVGVNASLVVGYAAGAKTPTLRDPSKYTWDFGSDGFSISIKIIPYFSVGIGVADVASVSLKISARLSWYIGFGGRDTTSTRYANLPMPHMTVGASLVGEVVVQIWLFTWVFPLTQGAGLGWPKLYDNWRIGKEWNTTPEGKMVWQSQAEDTLGAMADESDGDAGSFMTQKLNSLEEFMQKATIITDGSLTAVAESSEMDELKPMSEDGLWAMDDEEYEEYSFADYSGLAADYEKTLVDVYDDDYLQAGDDDPFLSMDYWYMTWFEAQYLIAENQAQGLSNQAEGEADAGLLEAADTPKEDSEGVVLTAQVDEQKVRVKSAKALRVGDHDYQNIPTGSSIKERGPELGLVPDQDVRLMSGVLSESRAQIVNVLGYTFLFRIGTVTMRSGQTRSRVMYSLLDANCGTDSYNRFIDFEYSKDAKMVIWARGERPEPNAFAYVGIGDDRGKPSRSAYYDYDYDVYVESVDEKVFGEKWARLHLVIVSGQRPHGDNTTIAEALTNPVITYLRFDVLIKRGNLAGDMNAITIQDWPTFARTAEVGELFKKTDILKTYPCHNISCPQIQFISNANDKGEDCQKLMITYLDRAAASSEKIITEEVNIFMGAMFTDIGARKSLTIVKADQLSEKLGVASVDGAIRSLLCTKRLSETDGSYLKDKHLIMFRSTTSVHYFFMESNTAVKHKGTKKYIENPKYNPDDPLHKEPEYILDEKARDYYSPEIVSVVRYNVPEGVTLPKLVEWPNHEGFLGVQDGKLQRFLWEGTNTNEPRLVGVDIAPEGFEVSGFGCDSTGNFIYYPSSREGDADFSSIEESDVDESGNYVEGDYKDEEPLADYRIMACKLHEGRFSEPFVFAELDHSVDLLEVVPSSPSCMGFVATTIIDPIVGSGEIWYTSMPNVRSLTVMACTSIGEFVFPGEKCLLGVTVRNEGNTYLKGFTARMRDLTAGVTYDESVQVVFSKDTLMESGYNPVVEGSTTGELQNVEPDFALAPGHCAQYQIEFTVPSDWTGTHKVTVLASDAQVADSDKAVYPMAELSAMSEDEFGFGFGMDLVAQAEEIIPYDFDWADDLAPWDEVDIVTLEELSELFDAPMQTPDTGSSTPAGNGTPKGGGTPAGSGSGSSGGGKPAAGGTTTTVVRETRSTLPNTADPSSMLGALAGAAGAAMLAYSSRRTRIEREMKRRGIKFDD